MPRLLLGHTVAGTGGGGVNVDDVQVMASGGTPGWVSSTEVVANGPPATGGSTFRVVTFNPSSPVPVALWPTEEGADTIKAGNGVIAAGLKSSSPYTRLVNDVGRTDIQGQIPWDVDRETGIAILSIYSQGHDIQVYPRNSSGPNAVIPTGPLYDARVLGRRVIWAEGRSDGIRLVAYDLYLGRGIPLQLMAGNLYQPLIFSAANKLFVMYSGQSGGIICHPIDDLTKGKRLPDGNYYAIDAEVQPSGDVKVVWSSNAGESAGSLHSVTWNLFALDTLSLTPGSSTGGPSGDVGGGGGSDTGSDEASTAITLVSEGTFEVAGASEEVILLPVDVWPSYPDESGHGRIVHPYLGAFDYEVKPDEWVNIDADAIVAPMWASTRTLTSAANVLWKGNLRDVVVQERWKALGGLAMPITQFRMLLALWTSPVDPDIGYVNWYPNYISNQGFKVILMGLEAGSGGLAFDDVVNYKDEDDNPIGWMTNPVTLTLKLVARLT